VAAADDPQKGRPPFFVPSSGNRIRTPHSSERTFEPHPSFRRLQNLYPTSLRL